MRFPSPPRHRAGLLIGCTALVFAATPSWASVPGASAGIDQAPILHVLRLIDVPGSSDQDLPSGALTAKQLAFNTSRDASSRRREVSLLDAHGFVSSAIAGYEGPGRLIFKSVAVELASSSDAHLVLASEAKLCRETQAPAGTAVTATRDTHLEHAILIRFTPSTRGREGGLQLLAQAGSYFYSLRIVAHPDDVSSTTLERLVNLIISRS